MQASVSTSSPNSPARAFRRTLISAMVPRTHRARDQDRVSVSTRRAPGASSGLFATVVAEKFQAMVALGMLNSRLKDFYDIWAIAGSFAFDGAVLSHAIQATFDRRQTPLPVETPPTLTPAFAKEKQTQWTTFLRRTEIALAPEPFAAIQAQIAALVMPPALALRQGGAFAGGWPSGGPWTER